MLKSRTFFYALMFALVLLMSVALFVQPELTPTIYAQDEDVTLVSVAVDEAPVLDGIADEAFWADAPELVAEVSRGANMGETTVYLKSVYSGDSVYFLLTWADPTESYLRFPWELQEDGTWKQLRDPEDKGGDDNLWYEDKMSLIWSINNSIEGFDEEGCFVACHRSEEGDPKPYGNKYTENEGELGDIWHWKSVRNLNQLHDQWLDNTPYSPETTSAGRHSDPSDSGGYSDNVDKTNPDQPIPAFMLPGADAPRDGSPGFILQSEAVPFDPAGFEPGDRIPGIVVSEFVGDGGDIAAGWEWADGVWTLEFGRKLDTGSELDVQFTDMAGVYYFGVAIFDNAQVRHAFNRDALAFVFEQ